MGCAHSKEGQNRIEGGLNAPLSRSFSMPVHHPAEKKGDSYHVVALTSSTYGILKMDPVTESEQQEEYVPRKEEYHPYRFYSFRKKPDRSSEMAAKTWSEVNNLLVNYKTQKSNHTKTGSNIQDEPEMINTWELMEGLEDNGCSPSMLSNGNGNRKSVERCLDRSFTFHSVKDVEQLVKDEPKVSIWHKVTPGVKIADENSQASSTTPNTNLKKNFDNGNGFLNGFSPVRADSPSTPADSITKTIWTQQSSSDDSSLTLFDPDLISTFRKAMDEISPRDSMEPVSEVCQGSTGSKSGEDDNGTPAKSFRLRSSSIQARVNTFQQIIDESSTKRSLISKKSSLKNAKLRAPPGGEDKVVLYFTSLRGIRKTFEDCCTVKLILRGFRVSVDERDISMHSPFRQELQDLLGKPMPVPRLFIGGKYIGGVEEIQQLHEIGEFVKYLEGFPVQAHSKPCDGCGDVRFIPCQNCDGSRKIFTEEEGQGLFIRCQQCNENGLVRCPVCCC